MSIKTVPPVSSGLETFDSRFGVPRPYGFVSRLVTEFDSIATVTVGTNAPAVVTLDNIPSSYQHLQLRALASNTQNSRPDIFVRFNEDATTNYVYHELRGTGSAVEAVGVTSRTGIQLGNWSPLSSESPIFSPIILDILDYATDKRKVVRNFYSSEAPSYPYVRLESGLWLGTSAINSISLTLQTNYYYRQHSTFALYGVKAP